MTAKRRISGAALAVAAASLAGYATMATISGPVAADENIHCHGVNSCKGQNDCGGENNSCKGMGSCKGQGFLSMTKAECDEKGGTVK